MRARLECPWCPWCGRRIFAGLDAKLAGGDHVDEQRTRRVFGLTESIAQDAQDAQADVESNEVREVQRPHRVRHTELHDLVNLRDTGHTSCKLQMASLIMGMRIGWRRNRHR